MDSGTSAVQSGLLGLFIGGSGIGAGGLIALLIGHARRNIVPILVSAAVGMMMTLILLDIVPESISVGGVPLTLLGIALGFIVTRQMEQFSHRIIIITNSAQKDVLIRSGLFLSFAVALHNFPAGIALGSSLVNTPELAKSLSMAMVVHAIPEGIALGLPLVLSNMSAVAILVTATVIGVPTGFGAYLGYLFGMIAPWAQSFMLGIAVGTILFVAVFEMIRPAWKESGGTIVSWGMVLGGSLGSIYLILF